MANTQVFTLGVTAIPSLGSALDALRRQVDGIRLGRLIGEVIRLGLELDKVRLVQRQLTTEQAWAHEDQIDRLRREGGEVERLRRRYLALGRKPIELRIVQVTAANEAGPERTRAAHEAAPSEGSKAATPPSQNDPSKPATAGQGQESAESDNTVQKVLGGLAGVALTAASLFGAYKGFKALPPSSQAVGLANAKTNLVPALMFAGAAGFDAAMQSNGRDQAKGAGVTLGGLMGTLGGALLGGLIKTRAGRKYGPVLGSIVGASTGGVVGTSIFDLFAGKPQADVKAAVAQKGSAATSASRSQADQADGKEQIEDEEEEEEEEEEEFEEVEEFEDQAPSDAQGNTSQSAQPASAMASAVLGVASLAGSLGKAGAAPAGASLARRAMGRVPGLSLLATGMQLADTYNSDATPEQKLEGYGTAVGGLGGGLAGAAAGAAIGSVVPVVGTLIGGLIGGALGSMGGESIGGLLGKALGSSSDDTPAVPSAAVQPAAAPAAAAPTPAVPTPPAPINQQFNFTANMPVTLTNSLSDPSVLQQLEAIARRQLDELMRQARSVQLADTPHIAL